MTTEFAHARIAAWTVCKTCGFAHLFSIDTALAINHLATYAAIPFRHRAIRKEEKLLTSEAHL